MRRLRRRRLVARPGQRSARLGAQRRQPPRAARPAPLAPAVRVGRRALGRQGGAGRGGPAARPRAHQRGPVVEQASDQVHARPRRRPARLCATERVHPHRRPVRSGVADRRIVGVRDERGVALRVPALAPALDAPPRCDLRRTGRWTRRRRPTARIGRPRRRARVPRRRRARRVRVVARRRPGPAARRRTAPHRVHLAEGEPARQRRRVGRARGPRARGRLLVALRRHRGHRPIPPARPDRRRRWAQARPDPPGRVARRRTGVRRWPRRGAAPRPTGGTRRPRPGPKRRGAGGCRPERGAAVLDHGQTRLGPRDRADDP